MSARIEELAKEASVEIVDYLYEQLKYPEITYDYIRKWIQNYLEFTIENSVNDLTPEEVHNLCHDLEKTVPECEFKAACEAYRRKLYGSSK